MHQSKQNVFSLLTLFFVINTFFFTPVCASEIDTQPPAHPYTAYAGDISKPDETIDTSSPENNSVKACQTSTKQWNTYSRPICECIPGDTIIPSKNNKILSYLFGNEADTAATLSVLGWKNNRCHLNFKEGSLIKNCTLSRKTLNNLMQQLLNPELFDTHSEFAQVLSNECQ